MFARTVTALAVAAAVPLLCLPLAPRDAGAQASPLAPAHDDLPRHQRAPEHSGFWLGGGSGAGDSPLLSCGRISSNCTGVASEDAFYGGWSAWGFIAAGGTLRPNLLVGGEVSAWSVSGQGHEAQLQTASAIVQYYPAPAAPSLFVKAGVGFGDLSLWSHQGDDGASASGPTAQLGVGYDFRVGARGAITPMVNYLMLFAGDATGSYGGFDMTLPARRHTLAVGIALHCY